MGLLLLVLIGVWQAFAVLASLLGVVKGCIAAALRSFRGVNLLGLLEVDLALHCLVVFLVVGELAVWVVRRRVDGHQDVVVVV